MDNLVVEVGKLAGVRYARKTVDQLCRRWESQKGSVVSRFQTANSIT